jgi:hypothetical protein
MAINQQTINIGTEPNDGTGDSIFVAFQKVNSNFLDVYTLLGFGAGFSFLRLKEAPSALTPHAILQVNDLGTKFLNKTLVAGTGINIDFVSSSTEIRIVNTASDLKSDKNPTLSADISGENAFSLINMDNSGPHADWDAVSRKWVYENFVNRDGITDYVNTSSFELQYKSSSTIRSNVQLLMSPTSSTHLVNKGYVDDLVDSSGFASKQNFYVSLSGDDHQYSLPSYKRGRAFAYAFKTVNRAAEAAEQFIAASELTLGPYQKTIGMSNGTATPLITEIVASTLLDASTFGIRLRLTLDAASINIGSDPFIDKSIFPGNYIIGATSEAVALIEAVTLDAINGYEYYDVVPYDYALPYRMEIQVDPFSYNAYLTSGGDITSITYYLDVADSIDLPDFWVGQKFVITNGSYNTISYGYITSINEELDEEFNVRDTITVDFVDGVGPTNGDLIPYDQWHVYAADFELNEELQWGQKQNKNQCTIMIESGEHEDQYPIKVPENCSIRGDEFRRTVIKPAPLYSTRLPSISGSKWANTYFYRDAQIDGIIVTQLDTDTDYAAVVGITINSLNNDPVSKTVTVTLVGGATTPSSWIGKIFKTSGSISAQGEIRSVIGNTFSVSLAQNTATFEKSIDNYTVGNTIASGAWHIYNPIEYGYHYLRDSSRQVDTLTTLVNSGGYNRAAALIVSNRDFIRAECLSYLTTTYPALVFDETKCSKDIGSVVDSLAYDLKNGGNNRTINSGDSYTLVTNTAATVATINYINTIGQKIIRNEPVTALQTAEDQIFDALSASLVSSGSDVILADLVQACSRIINNDPAFNPPKYNDQMDVCLMNDATINRYISAQGHGGFMKVLDPDGQILAKSPYTQTASSFSKSKNRHVFSGGMFIDGFAGNTVATPSSIVNISGNPVKINATATPASLGRPSVVPNEGYIRPQVPCFFVNRGVTYEVAFISDWNQTNGTGSLNLNPLRPGGIATVTGVAAYGFKSIGPDGLVVPVRFSAPTQTGGLSSTGTAVISSAGNVTAINISFPGSGYINKTYTYGTTDNTPLIVIGGARISWTRNSSGGITGWEIIDGGVGYAIGTVINFPSSGGTSATATVATVDSNGAILTINITGAGSGYLSDPQVTFGSSLAYTLTVKPGFVVTSSHPLPTEITLITAGNRSMLANDFTQMNDLGYGIFSTNGGLVENVSMFTYYCYSAYYSTNGAQCRSIAGSTSYGLNGLKAEGSDPTEVPIPIRTKRATSQIVTVNSTGAYINKKDDATIYVDGLSYDPIAQSQLEINHSGTVVTYNVKSAVQDPDTSSIWSLSVDDGTGQGLRYSVENNLSATLRVYYNQEILDVNAATLSRPSTVLTLDEDPNYVYRVLKYTDLGGDTALAESDTPYNYILATPWTEGGVYRQGLGEITITNGGSGFTPSTQYAATIDAPSTYGSATLVGTPTNTAIIDVSGTSGTIMIGSRIYIGAYPATVNPTAGATYVEWINSAGTQIKLSNEITSSGSVNFVGTQAAGYGVANSSGIIDKIVLTNQGAGYASYTARNISISGGSTTATATAKPTGITGTKIIKIVDLDEEDAARITTGLAASTPYYYIFGFEGILYKITGYKNSVTTNNEWGELTVEKLSDGTSLATQVLSATMRAGIMSNQSGDITVRISTMRVTGHDMLNVGTGGYADSKYPNDLYGPPNNAPDSSLEVQEVGKGRVYYATTDQDGNFKVGKFFSVDQGRGTVSISAPISLTNVDGISFKRGQTLVQVFSVDGTMGGNSNNSVPTERAIQTYVNSRLGLNRNNTTAGVSQIGNGFLDRGGVLEMAANIKMGDNRVTDMADPVNPKDAINLRYLETKYVNTSGDTMVGALDMSSNKITSLGDAAADQDALNRRTGDLRYINTAGDTMVGTLTSQKVSPSATLTYDLGETGARYVNVYGNKFLGTASTALTWDASRTVSFATGDVTGSFSINGSADVSNVVLTIAANSVALGTDTSGDYVSTGATSGFGLSGSTSGETQTFTVSSNATSTNAGDTIVFRDGSGNFSAGTITVPGITKSGTAGSGDIGQTDNTFATVYATTFSGVATTAKYADLAEKYLPDAVYEPGTVIIFGGDQEVTIAKSYMDRRIAGVVSTNPAYMMNSEQDGGVYIALTGRVPCKVVGTIKKGDMLVSSGAPGIATSEKNPALGSVIGKALENYDSQTVGVIEVVVGRI